MKRRFAFLVMGLLCAMGAFGAAAEVNSYMLLGAVLYNDVAEVRRLIADGADVNIQDDFGNTPLMWAVSKRSTGMAVLLLDAGADVEAKNEDGMTALIEAAYHNAPDMAKFLLAVGADVNAQDWNGRTALMYAADNKSADMAEILLAAGTANRLPLRAASSGRCRRQSASGAGHNLHQAQTAICIGCRR